jgi:hypothetical protein
MPPLERGGTHALETAGETPGAFLRIVLSTVVPIRVSCLKWRLIELCSLFCCFFQNTQTLIDPLRSKQRELEEVHSTAQETVMESEARLANAMEQLVRFIFHHTFVLFKLPTE